MQNLTFLSASHEAGLLKRVQSDFDQKEATPSFSIDAGFQTYYIVASNCELQTAKPWTEESFRIFKGSDIRCIVSEGYTQGHYEVIAMPGIEEKELHGMLLDFVA